MNLKSLTVSSIVAVGTTLFLGACSQSDSENLVHILNIPDLPPATKIENCAEITRDGEPMWDCIIQTNPDDLRRLLSGHQFSELRVDAPERVHIARPKNFKAADWIHVLYEDNSGKAVIATHAP